MHLPSIDSFLPPYKYKQRHKLYPPSLQANTPKMCTPWTLRRLLHVGHQSNDRRLDLSNSRSRLEDNQNNTVFATIQPSQSNNTQPSTSAASPRQDRPATALITRQDRPRNNETALAPSRISVVRRGKKHKRKVTIGSNHTSSGSSSLADVEVGVGDETDWPPFTDEDYIVFCFEEDGEFHVVMDENSKSQDCFDHGHSPRTLDQEFQDEDDSMGANRRDCLLPNKAVEEESFYFSPRLQSDGIKSLTRFKADVDIEDMKMVKARGRVDEGLDYEELDGIKRRVQCNEGEEEEEEISREDDLEFPKTSMECRDGSVESSGSSQSDWVRQLQVTKTDQELGLSSSSQAQGDPSQSKNGDLDWVDDEESLYLSPESQRGSQGYDEHLNDEDEEAALDSAQSICSTSSSSSFQFPVLQWDSIGSPVKWPRSHSIRLRKPKSRRVCLRCCRF